MAATFRDLPMPGSLTAISPTPIRGKLTMRRPTTTTLSTPRNHMTMAGATPVDTKAVSASATS